ncbi:hypothetical protein [Streptomyces sp. AC555_RSS877]|uniref:hypothetical protein n=1 Tax=Streptomyces sp. AC555_RSS877 TaxID=2823688 RepID=UPI001C254092|nr:hypothetical protein [Streptomyces sp. AC555_RSS877]
MPGTHWSVRWQPPLVANGSYTYMPVAVYVWVSCVQAKASGSAAVVACAGTAAGKKDTAVAEARAARGRENLGLLGAGRTRTQRRAV